MTPSHAAQVLRAFVTTYHHRPDGTDAPATSLLLALDALDVLDAAAESEAA